VRCGRAMRGDVLTPTIADGAVRETGSLELHHREAPAMGGPDSLDNLELRCPPHNLLAAEQDFGRSHMDRRRGKAPPSLAARERSDLAGGAAKSDPAT